MEVIKLKAQMALLSMSDPIVDDPNKPAVD